MADTRIILSDEYTKAERRRYDALVAAALLLQHYQPTAGKTRSGVAIDVAKRFEEYMTGAT